MFFLLIGLIILLCNLGRSWKSYCSNDECLRSAANLKYSMDLSVDPCEDFYHFTCGHWSEEHPNHGWYTSFSSFAAVNERITVSSYNFLIAEDDNDTLPVVQSRMLYQSCLDQESADELGFTTIYEYLEQVGLPRIPHLFSALSDEEKMNFKFDWLTVEADIKKTFSKDIFIGFIVDVNIYNVSENVMIIGSPGNQCPLPSPFLNIQDKNDYELIKEQTAEGNNGKIELKDKIRKKVVKYVITEMMKNSTSDIPSEELLDQAAFVINNITNTIDELSDNFTSNGEAANKYTFHGLQEEIDKFTMENTNKKMPDFLQKYIGRIFENIENVTIDFNEDIMYIQDGEKPYIFHIMSFLLDTSDIYIELYMWWSTVLSMIINTTTDVVEYITKETEVLYVSSHTNSRSKSVECVELVNTFMGMAVTYGIADRAFANKSGLHVRHMLDDIRESFKSSVEGITWMDEETKKATLDKSENMYSFIGYPSWLFEDGKIEKYYEGLVINETTFLQNLMKLVEREMPKHLSKLRLVNKKEFIVNPTEVNAYNYFADNSIIVPLAFLTYPLYHLGLEVLNYGSIGTVLGHELTHGFDNKGRKHDIQGNYKQWWSNATIETFERKTECFVKQYDNITIEGAEGQVSGERTLGENIADNGGLNHAYRAYKNYMKRSGCEPSLPGFENYTHDQLFFIAFGSIWCENASTKDIEEQLESDAHCPNPIRVNMGVSNSKDFAKAFHCKVGSKMNPEKNARYGENVNIIE
ncbi:hypothetical protein HHI36_009647 [Cryptolaemus montrouzieri]|uniref:Endothelin-converting enzyme 1 n=1 Tax=Cryptolaemus montrouzieri TaxID=559131 RepID=A0ABD2MGF7_9CUCU